MPRLNYLGPDPSDGNDLASRSQANTVLSGAPTSQSAAKAAIAAEVAIRAPKGVIDSADSAFATYDYYSSRDALNVPLSSIGAVNGVASLVSGKIPQNQVPVLGSGYLRGPFGPTTITSVPKATTTAVKLAEFAIGVQSVAFQPLGYALVAVDTTPGGRPLIEMRISDGATGTQTVFAQGIGRPAYSGRQIVAITPGSPTLGASNPLPYAVGTDIVVTLWVSSSSTTPVAVSSSSLLSAAVFLVRMLS